MTPEGITVIVGLSGSLLYGVWTDWRKRGEVKKIVEGKDELIKIHRDEVLAWKERFESKDKDLKAYQRYAHDKNQEDNLIVLRLTEENANLKGKTDLTPVLEHMREDQKVTAIIVDTLGKVATTMDILLSKLESNKVIT